MTGKTRNPYLKDAMLDLLNDHNRLSLALSEQFVGKTIRITDKNVTGKGRKMSLLNHIYEIDRIFFDFGNVIVWTGTGNLALHQGQFEFIGTPKEKT